MSEVGADAAQRYREHMRSKAERLGGGEDAQRVDASSFTPGEKLYAGVKTGMRPVSRQTRADGGPVSGGHAAATPGRAARKSGGGVGESYVNRDAKSADEDREGHYPNGGMKKGGRAERKFGGYIEREEREGGAFTRELKKKTASSDVEKGGGRPAAEDGRLGRASGGRASRQAGGPLASPLSSGMGGQGRFNFNYGPQQALSTKLGLKDGGRAKAHERYGHGPSCACSECRGGRVGKAGGGFNAGDLLTMGALPMAIKAISGGYDDDDDNKPAYAPGSPGKKAGGRAGRANGGAAPGPAEDIGAVGQPSFKHRAPKGENSSRARTLAAAKERADGGGVKSYSNTRGPDGKPIEIKPTAQPAAAIKGGRAFSNTRGDDGKPIEVKAKGGSVEAKVLTAHRAEHEAMAKGKAKGGGAGGNDDDDENPRGPVETVMGKVSKGAHRYAKGLTRQMADIENAGRQQRARPAPVVSKALFPDEDDRARGGKARARGGRSGKGKTNINIVIAPGGGGQQPPPPPGMNPQLAIRPPTPAAPMPMPGAAPAPGAPSPMPMPIPIPMGGGAPGGMPPRARGGRAPKVGGEPEAGSGSGLGRLQKTAAYGHRSREGEGMRK